MIKITRTRSEYYNGYDAGFENSEPQGSGEEYLNGYYAGIKEKSRLEHDCLAYCLI